MKLALIGMGSIGMLFASRLMPTTELRCFAITHRAAQAAALNEKGLVVQDADGHKRRCPCPAVPLAEWNGAADWGLVFVKQPHLPDLLRRLREKPSQPARFLLFQNGLGHLESVAAVFPEKPLYAAVTTEGALRVDDTTVCHTGQGITWLGAVRDDGRSADAAGRAQLEQLAALLGSQGLDVRITEQIRERMWEKWVINCAINPLTGVMSVQNGMLAETPHLRDLALEAAEEAVRVARVCGVMLDGEAMGQKVLEVCEKTALNRSSMLQDLLHHRETEIEALNGLLIRLAAERGVEVPVNRVIYRLLKAAETVRTKRFVRESVNDGGE